MGLIFFCCTLALASSGALGTEFEKVFEWKQLAYADLPDLSKGNGAILFSRTMDVTENETFQAYNSVPMGATHHRGRIFITIPRRRPGVPATLNVIDLSKVTAGDRSPPLRAYPTYPINELQVGEPFSVGVRSCVVVLP